MEGAAFAVGMVLGFTTADFVIASILNIIDRAKNKDKNEDV